MRGIRAWALCALALCLALGAARAAEPADAWLGQPMPAVTLTAADGRAFDLAETLGEADAVLIGLFDRAPGECGEELRRLAAACAAVERSAGLALFPADMASGALEAAAARCPGLWIAPDSAGLAAALGLERGVAAVDRFGAVALLQADFPAEDLALTSLLAALTDPAYIRTSPMTAYPRRGALLSLPRWLFVREETQAPAVTPAPTRTPPAYTPVPEACVWTVRFVDQQGEAVPGCLVNFCTDTLCVPVRADEGGTAVFTGAPFAYHLQVIRVPAGYVFDTAQTFYTAEYGGEMTFTVAREEAEGA